MQWDRIIKIYQRSCGETPESIDEQYDHINFAYERVWARTDQPEGFVPNEEISTVADQDWISATLASQLYSIHSIVNKTDGRKVDPEPGGFRGRARYLETAQTRPPTGNVHFYVRKGTKIWLRDTPDSIDTLIVSYKYLPAEFDSSVSVTTSPAFQRQYHMAIPLRAAASYFELHPPILEGGQRDLAYSQSLKQASWDSIGEVPDPRVEERRDSRHWVRQMGYDFGIRGR